MSAFEFYFSFFGLLLGLAAANIATGFARLWRMRDGIAIGLCVPLLATVLMINVMANWMTAWNALQTVTIAAPGFTVGLLVALPYVVSSVLIFPDASEDWSSLDAFYLAHSRLLMLLLMVPVTIGMIGFVLIRHRTYGLADLLEIFATTHLVPLILIVWRDLRVHRIGLALILLMDAFYFYT